MTLPEAGIILSRASNLIPGLADSDQVQSPYFISKETRDKVKEILKALPEGDSLQGQLFNEVMAQRSTFIPADQIDPAEFDKIAQDYSNALKAYGYDLNLPSFTLAAISKDGKTYILPNFKNLSPEQQAMILIHERFMRVLLQPRDGKPAVSMDVLLPRVLELDGLIYKQFHATSKNQQVDPVRFAAVLHDLEYYTQDKLDKIAVREVFTGLKKSAHRPIFMSDFVLDPSCFDTSNFCYYRQDVNPAVLKGLSSYDARAYQTFSKARVDVALETNYYAKYGELGDPLTLQNAEGACRALGARKKVDRGLPNDFMMDVDSHGNIIGFICNGNEVSRSGKVWFKEVQPTY
jgi:hypothetical protein